MNFGVKRGILTVEFGRESGFALKLRRDRWGKKRGFNRHPPPPRLLEDRKNAKISEKNAGELAADWNGSFNHGLHG